MKMPLGWLWRNDHGAQRLRKDGAHLPVSLNVSVVPDAHGTIVGPPSARAMVEGRGDSASEAARYARSLIETSVNPLVATNPQGKITDVNAATEEATGIPRDQLIGTDFADCFREPEEARAAFKRVLEEGLLSEYPLALRHVSGRLTDVVYNATVYRDESGELQAVFAAARDTAEAQEARRQVARLALIAASSQCAVFSRDLAGVITSWNAAAEALYGYAAAEAIGRNGTILTPPGREGETQEIIKRMLRGDRGFGFETQRLHKDGSLVDVAFTLSAIRDAAGDITGLSITDHDISERKQAEEALRESEGFLRGLFDNMPSSAAIYEVRGDGSRGSDYIIKGFNAAGLRVEGKTEEEVVGKSLFDLRPAIDEYGLIPVFQRVWRTGEPALFPTTLYSDEYYTNWYENRVFRLPSGEIVAIYDDVTERRQVEEELSESEARYRGYVDNAPYGVFVSDEQGRYLEVNQAAADLTGYAREELVQLSIPDVLAPESRDWGRRHFGRLLRAGHSSGDGVFLRKDGTTFPARVDAVRLTATRYLGFIIDVSEEQRAAAELGASAAQLKQALTATVAALGATTELRDPYTAGHQGRVAELAGAIAARLGWDAARIEIVTTAGLLHDVGKIIVPAEILAKPGRVSELEMQIIRGHAAASAALIAGIEFGGPVAAIVNQHHERLDGSGYPQGLTGADILPEARILAVADVVEAMSSHRPYRPAFGIEVALAEVREHAGEKYDADVIAVCSRLIEEEGFQFTP